ncbi:Os03g0730433, partial [Oryza sativa Japonica Group]
IRSSQARLSTRGSQGLYLGSSPIQRSSRRAQCPSPRPHQHTCKFPISLRLKVICNSWRKENIQGAPYPVSRWNGKRPWKPGRWVITDDDAEHGSSSGSRRKRTQVARRGG